MVGPDAESPMLMSGRRPGSWMSKSLFGPVL